MATHAEDAIELKRGVGEDRLAVAFVEGARRGGEWGVRARRRPGGDQRLHGGMVARVVVAGGVLQALHGGARGLWAESGEALRHDVRAQRRRCQRPRA